MVDRGRKAPPHLQWQYDSGLLVFALVLVGHPETGPRGECVGSSTPGVCGVCPEFWGSDFFDDGSPVLLIIVLAEAGEP